MASQHILTEANQEEMREKLQQLAAFHKKAKLQELFERQDELRPHQSTVGKRPKHRRSRSVPTADDIEAMKSQFHDLHQETLLSQSCKQYLLRLQVLGDCADGEQYHADWESETPMADLDGASAQSNAVRREGSDGEHKVDSQDVEDMKAEFGRYQKALLSTQFEKGFRLRAHCDGEAAEQAIAQKMSQQDSEEMKDQFRRLSKSMLAYKSMKQIDSRVEAQIKPKHRQRFDDLMQDIGIINETVTDRLWLNVENTVRFEKVAADDEAEIDVVGSLKREVRSLRQHIRCLEDRIKAMQSVPDSGRESQDVASVEARESVSDFVTSGDEEGDDAMVIID